MLSSLFCHSTGSSFPCQVGHLKETRKTLPVVQQKKNASLVHLWIFTRGQCLLKIIQTFYLLGKGKGITSSITTTLELHLPSIPLVTKRNTSPSNHFYSNYFSIAHQVCFVHPLSWYICKIALVQIYRYGNNMAPLNSTQRAFVLWSSSTFGESISFVLFCCWW